MINWKLPDELITEAFRETVGGLAEECTNQIESEKWNWPRVTDRKNGAVVFSPRDIVDTGTLRDSQEIHEISDNYSEIHYPVEYALWVHEGGIIERADGTETEIPPRPFIDAAVREYKPLEAFENNLGEKLKYDYD